MRDNGHIIFDRLASGFSQIDSPSGTTKPIVADDLGQLFNTDWPTPFTLTTTGTSGAATFDGTTLNIPNYATGGSSLTINNNANNRILTANGGTTSIEAESNLTWDGTYFIVNGQSAVGAANIKTPTSGIGLFIRNTTDDDIALLINSASANEHIFYGNGIAHLAMNGILRVGTNTGSGVKLMVSGTVGKAMGAAFKGYTDSDIGLAINNAANSLNQHMFYSNGNATLSNNGGTITIKGTITLPTAPTTYSSGSYDVLVRNQTSGNVEVTTITGGGSGTVTSVNASISGALGVTGGPVTGSGTLAFAWQGSSSQYVRGDGSLVSIPSTPGIDTVLAVGESLTANRNIPGAFNLSVGTGSVTVGATATVGAAKFYVNQTATGLGAYFKKDGFPNTSENSFGADFQRIVGSGTFSGTNSVLGGYGELGFNSGDFVFTGPAYTGLGGINGVVTIYPGGGSLTANSSMFAGGQYNLFVSGTGTIDKFACVRAIYPILVPAASFTGTITNHYGLYIDDTTTSSVSSSITNRYGIYQQGASDVNQFAGVIKTSNDIEVTAASKGIILRAPGGGRWRVTVNDSGVLVTTSI